MSYAQNGILVVQNYCELVNRGPDDCAAGGGLAYVVATGQYFRMDVSASPPAVNGVTVFSSFGGPAQAGCTQLLVGTNPGRWVLTDISDAGGGPAALQADWYINPVSGSDLNTGDTALSPLKTFNGLRARWGSVIAPSHFNVTVYIVGATSYQLAAGDHAVLSRPGTPNFPVRLFGNPHQITTGTATASVLPNPATNTSATITGAPLDGWAAHIGQILRITQVGALKDYWCVIVEDLGAGVAKTTPLVLQSVIDTATLTEAALAIAAPTTYEILAPFSLSDGASNDPLYVNVPNGDVWIYDCNINDAGGGTKNDVYGIAAAASVHSYRGAFTCNDAYPVANTTFELGGNHVLTVNGMSGEACFVTFKASAIHLEKSAISVGWMKFMQDCLLYPNTQIAANVAHYLFENLNIDKAASPAIDLSTTVEGVAVTATFSRSLYGTTIPTTHISMHANVKATYSSNVHWYAAVTALQHPLDFQNAILKDYADLPFCSRATFADSQASLTLQQ